MSEKLKKLTGKNKNDYEIAASDLINNCDVELFKELVESDSFLFDFVKQNVSQRIAKVINEQNYRNLLKFLSFYSPYYDEVIISNLVKYADEDLTDTMLDKFSNGNDNEKAYAAKFFGYIQDPLAREFLIDNAYSTNEFLAGNCALALALWQDEESYNNAIERLKNPDDFEKLAAVKFLVCYGNKSAIPKIIEAMKDSAMSENIAGEIPYLESLLELIDNDFENGLLVINNIVNGLGEIFSPSCVFDYELFDVFEKLVNNYSKCAVVLLNAQEKFDTLTENDEYLFDEDKDTKNEIHDIKKILKNIDKKELKKYINSELREDSPFVFTALELADDVLVIRELLKSDNQTVILKTAEILKKLGNFDETARTVALLKVTDINIKSIIRAL